MRRTFVVIFDTVICSLLFYRIEHRFELADHDHIVEDALQAVGAEFLLFRFEIRLVSIERNRCNFDLTSFTYNRRIYR
jgi:hypothetical protein